MRRSGEISLFLGLLGLDQATKAIVQGTVPAGSGITITAFLNLVLVWNPGVSFGMLAGMGGARPGLLVVATVLVAAGLGVWLWREQRRLARTALLLVIAGALGNLVDRLRFGAVVDFVDVHLWGYHWPAFNVADSAIVIGAGLLLLDGLVPTRAATSEVGGKG